MLKVHLLARGPKLRASAAMQDRAKAHPKVTVHLNTGVQDAYADPKGNMGGLILKDSTTGRLSCNCLHNPVQDQVLSAHDWCTVQARHASFQ